MNSIVVLTGPTASGKSALALALAKQIGAEIVNADSVQLYRGFDIGSAKPTSGEMREVPHHLYSVVRAGDESTVATYCSMADLAITEICARARIPLLVGGSGLYIRSLLCGLVEVGPPTPEARAELARREAYATEQDCAPAEMLYRWLSELDPVSAEMIHPADLVRIRRAILVRLSSGESLFSLKSQHAHGRPRYRALVLVYVPERESLYAEIERRVDLMFESGLVDEVRKLREEYGSDCKPFGALGYRHVLLFLDGQLSFEAMRQQLKRDTRRFAKRQLTWWRNQPNVIGWEPARVSRTAERLSVSSLAPAIQSFISQEYCDGLFCNEKGTSGSATGVSYLYLSARYPGDTEVLLTPNLTGENVW